MLDVPIKLEGNSVYLRDVSISGTQIECDRALEIGSRTNLSINIPADYHRFFGERKQIALQMDVKWCTPHPEIPDLYQAGGAITSIEDQSKQDLLLLPVVLLRPVGRGRPLRRWKRPVSEILGLAP